ncbi:MAG: excinuclease ABC subunit UvrC [Candidatus Bathyarchaeota archaeon]|nr:excinuclease ABC subunit UvrC [Candidatus Bathyarchaeota archaeon]
MIQIASPSEFKSADVPTNPGVYIFKDKEDEILYIGKAKNLRARVKSYFTNAADQPAKTRQLVSKIRSIDWIVVNNEVEALLLENKLIKQHTPRYNIDLKDAKTFAYIALTKETFPRILTSRKVSRKLESFGPYTDGFTRQDLQKLVVRVFKLRTCKTLPKRACLNFHIGLCTAPCIGKVTATQYATQVEQARLFLKGNYEQTATKLQELMKKAAAQQKYEEALELRNQIASIRLLTQRQIVDKEKLFDQDIIVFRRVGEKVLAVHMGVRKGVLLGKKEFNIDLQPEVEEEFLKAYYSVNVIPREILLNKPLWQDKEEKAALEEFLSEKRGAKTTLTIPRRGTRLELVQLAEKNLETIMEENSTLLDLQNFLNLPNIPHIIECFDVSNLGQEHLVAGMVRFTNAKPDKPNYRKFKIKTVTGQDDFSAIHEAVTRRYKRLTAEKATLPDLVVIDGGAGQVRAAEAAMKALGLQLPLIGLAKEHEEIYLPNDDVPRRVDKNNHIMLLLRKIRDEAHNFSLRYNIKRRELKMREEFKLQRKNKVTT